MAHVRNSHSRRAAVGRSGAGKRRPVPAARASRTARGRAGAHIRGPGGTGRVREPRQERATRTVEAIVTAAAEILVRRGYAAASTNAIAERAGVSIGSLYQYFRDKDSVFRAVVDRHRREVMPVIAEMLERMRRPGADIVELTLELLRRMAAVNGSNPRLLAAIDRELGWLEREDDGEAAVLEAASAVLRSRLVRHPFPVEVTATLILAIVAPLSRWMVHSKPAGLDAGQLVSAFGRMLRGLLDARA